MLVRCRCKSETFLLAEKETREREREIGWQFGKIKQRRRVKVSRDNRGVLIENVCMGQGSSAKDAGLWAWLPMPSPFFTEATSLSSSTLAIPRMYLLHFFFFLFIYAFIPINFHILLFKKKKKKISHNESIIVSSNIILIDAFVTFIFLKCNKFYFSTCMLNVVL